MNKKAILLILASIMMSCGCEKLSFNRHFDGSLTDTAVWSNPDYAEGVLLNAYKEMPETNMHYGDDFLDVATDNALSNSNSGIAGLVRGEWEPEANPIGRWSEWYSQIRNVNLWIENGQDAPYKLSDKEYNAKYVSKLLGEAYFLRAWYYFNLLQVYGGYVGDQVMGVPYFKTVAAQDSPEVSPRLSYMECVENIVADCDSAAAHLPKQYTDPDGIFSKTLKGRATSPAALALKSRVLLYAASERFNPENDAERWSIAAQAAYDAIMACGPWALLKHSAAFYQDFGHQELIMARMNIESNKLEKLNRIPSENGNGRTAPSQNLVDAFPDKDGFPIAESSIYDPENPYADRDPRLGYFILCNGNKSNSKTVMSYLGGSDAPDKAERTSRTAYFLKKWLNLSLSNDSGNESRGNHVYPLFRKTELFLNFAEAANHVSGPASPCLETGKSALDAINVIRGKYDMKTDYASALAVDGEEAFAAFIENERRIELCFEDHRFFDVRRWNYPLERINEPIKGVEITQTISKLLYEYKVIETPSYRENMYSAPIPYTEVNRGLLQNNGW